MSGEMMQFPNNMKQFLDKYSFLDKERIYTNGNLLIPTFRAEQALEYYVPKWNSINNGLPCMELVYESSFNNNYESKNVLIQTKRDEIYSAYCVKTVYKDMKFKEKINWYTYSTGGRRMKVMSKVVAWMPLPELYTGE